MKGFQHEWALASYSKQKKLFVSPYNYEQQDSSVESEQIISLIKEITQTDKKADSIPPQIIQLSQLMLSNSSISVAEIEDFSLSSYLIDIMTTRPQEEMRVAILRIFILWIHQWATNANFLTNQDFCNYLAEFIFSENASAQCVYLSLNLLNRILISQPILKIQLIEQMDIVKNLIDCFSVCTDQKLRDEILLCIWSLLHTNPHPDYEHISSVTDLFIDLFTNPNLPNFEKRVYIASVFVECSANCAFVLCELFSPAEIFPVFDQYSDEVKISILDLINSILLTDDTCTSMSITSGMSLDFFGLVANSENEELILSAVRMLAALFRNEECTMDLMQSALDDGIVEELFKWAELGSYQIRRYSIIALLQAIAYQTDVVFHYFIVEKGFFQIMSFFLDLGSQIVTKEVLNAIIRIENYCTSKQPSIAETMASLNLKQEAMGIDPFDPSDIQELEMIKEGLMVLNDEPLEY